MPTKLRDKENIVEELVKLPNVTKNMNECLWLGDRRHRTLYVNPAFERMSGYKLKDCLNKDWHSFFDENTVKKMEKTMKKEGETANFEGVMVTKKGKSIPMMINNSSVGEDRVMGICTNIADVKTMSKRQAIADQIIRNSREAIVIMDKQQKVQLWNTGAQRLFGYDEVEMLDKNLDEMILPEGKEFESKKLIEEVEKNNFVQNAEISRRTKSGELADLSLSLSKVKDEKGEYIGYMAIYQDISQQKQLNEELQKRFEAIQDAYKELGLQKREIDYIYEINNATVDDENVEVLANIVVSAASLLTKADAAVLRLLTDDKKFLKLIACTGVHAKWWDNNKVPYENSIMKDAIDQRRALIVDNVASSARFKGTKLLKEHKFSTMISIPLVVHREVIGSLNLYTTNTSKFRLIETDFLENFGNQCAISLYVKLRVAAK